MAEICENSKRSVWNSKITQVCVKRKFHQMINKLLNVMMQFGQSTEMSELFLITLTCIPFEPPACPPPKWMVFPSVALIVSTLVPAYVAYSFVTGTLSDFP